MMVWNLEEAAGATWRPLWQSAVAELTGVASLGSELLLVAARDAVALLDAASGARSGAVTLPGRQGATCCCRTPGGAVAIGCAEAGVFVVRPVAATAAEAEALSGTAGAAVCGVEAVGASWGEVVAATSDGGLFVWCLTDGSLLATVNMLTLQVIESLSWSSSTAEAVQPSVVGLLAIDELVVCTVATLHGGCAVIALHAQTGALIPHPWHEAGPLGGLRGGGVAAVAPLTMSRNLHLLAADPGLEWVVAACAGVADGEGSTSLVARSRLTSCAA